jgi:hypothetical protein
MGPNPQHQDPQPDSLPPEVDTGGLHSKPEVDYGNETIAPIAPRPDVIPGPEKVEPPGPDTNPQ